MPARRRTAPLLIALLACGLAAAEDVPPRRFRAGRPLAEALAALRPMGLDLIFSSDLVGRGVRVLAEPVASEPRGILEDLIAPHGLVAREGPGGTLLVVRDVAAGSTGAVSGRILGDAHGRPAPGARVSVPGTEIAVQTTGDGRFLIHRLAPGRWPLDVRSADGGSQQTLEVTVRAGEATRVAIELARAPTLIEEVVVTPTQYEILGDEPESRRTLEAEELARLAHLGDDAQRAPARLPGVAAGDKSARFSLRGGEWNEVLVVLDGLEIDEPYHLEEFLAFSGIVDSQAIEKVDLLAGGFPAEYGGRMSGVMELTSSSPTEPSTVVAGTGMPNSRVLVEGRSGSGSTAWLFAGRAWYPDALVDLVDPGGEDINPSYYDVLGKTAFHLAGGTTISGHLLAARDRIDFSGEELEEGARARYNTTYAWVNVASPWTPRLFSATQLSMGAVETDRGGTAEDPDQGRSRVDDERVSRFTGVKQDWLFRASDRWLAKWGFDTRFLDAEYDYLSHTEIVDPIFAPSGTTLVVDRRIVARPSGTRLGAYAAVKARLLPPLTAEAGLRWERQSYTDDAQLDPRVNLVWAAGRRSTVRAAWGLFHQPQRIDELQVEDGIDAFLPAQLSQHRVVSFEHALGSGLQIRVDGYWKSVSHPRPRFENLFDPIELFPEAESDRVRVAPRRASFRGVEAFLRKEAASGLGWRAGYALSVARDDVGGRPEPRSWDQTHAVNAGLSWRWGAGWELDLDGAWHTGWPTTRVDAGASTDPNGVVVVQPALGRRNAERFGPYHRMDVRFTRRARLPVGGLVMSLEMLNLYDRDNVCCVERFRFHPDVDGSVRVERREGFWLGWLPSFGITWEF